MSSEHLGWLRVTVLVFVLILLMGCAAKREAAHLPLTDVCFSFSHPPYVHPKIVEDLSSWISDVGDQVVAINLSDSQVSNRYWGEVLIKDIPGQSPFVYVWGSEVEKNHQSLFGYQHIGTTQSGIYVLRTESSGGGSGVFVNLLFLILDHETGTSFEWDKSAAVEKTDRSVLRRVGEAALGDRWDGELRVEGNRVVVGRDSGQFAGWIGPGGGPLSNEPRDRFISLDGIR